MKRIAEKWSAEVIPYLDREVEDSTSPIRLWALLQILEHGDKAAATVPMLQQLQTDDQLGETAHKALAKIGSRCAHQCS